MGRVDAGWSGGQGSSRDFDGNSHLVRSRSVHGDLTFDSVALASATAIQ